MPDLQIYTESNSEDEQKGSFADAIMMAWDAIGIKCIEMEDKKKCLKEPTDVEKIEVQNGFFSTEGKSVASVVDVDLTTYRREMGNKSVRRNVSLPN